ncbi:FAD-dependent oxidoreductase [Meiothermus sp.]|nr:FAD-dependent oxidoreductase [Meiothermus sp.]
MSHSASSTFEAQSAIRVKQNCHSMGEAAGVAAA